MTRKPWMRRALVGAIISLSLLGLALYIGYFLIKEPGDPDTLRFAAQTRKFLIGAAVAARPLSKDPSYAQTLAREFNMVVAENAMKFSALHPRGPEFDFTNADAIVDFAATHGMRIRGHTLVWWGSIPQWLIDKQLPASKIADILKNHVHTVVDRYRGRIYAWDVVNEAIGQNYGIADTIWSKALGADYIAQVFIWAHQADPEAKLFYNDYGSELLGPRSDAIYSLLQNLIARGIPVDGVGVESHLLAQHPPDFSEVAKSLERLAALGLEIHITELDVRIELPVTDEKLQQQAEVYRRYLGVCLSIPNCKAFTMWGFTDKYSWIPKFSPGSGAALPFDDAYRPKPAYYALHDVLYGSTR